MVAYEKDDAKKCRRVDINWLFKSESEKKGGESSL